MRKLYFITLASSLLLASCSKKQEETPKNSNVMLEEPKQEIVPSPENGKQFIEQSDCRSCHDDTKKLIGPSYEDVAKKYENNEKNIDYLAEKIVQGGTGVWGEIPMLPHHDLSKDKAKAMATYILSLKNNSQ